MVASHYSLEGASDLSPDDIAGDLILLFPIENLLLNREQKLRVAKALKMDVLASGSKLKDRILSCLYPESLGIVHSPFWRASQTLLF